MCLKYCLDMLSLTTRPGSRINKKSLESQIHLRLIKYSAAFLFQGGFRFNPKLPSI